MTPHTAPRQPPLTPSEAQILAILAGREAGFAPPGSDQIALLRRRRLVARQGDGLTPRGHRALRMYRQQNNMSAHK